MLVGLGEVTTDLCAKRTRVVVGEVAVFISERLEGNGVKLTELLLNPCDFRSQDRPLSSIFFENFLSPADNLASNHYFPLTIGHHQLVQLILESDWT